ncbi:MAG TPA: DUF3800 domain-containing protein [Rhizomicrobium sp.]|nr:DUF3800 domain-containing protein [Rhizomicrobium sp.]
MASTYYIDESGNTGDLARQHGTSNFDSQPVFVLACIGCDDGEDLAIEIERLKTIYKVQAPELKSSSLVSKPAFITELAQFMREQQYPLLVEIVDKRYCLVTYIVSLLILTPLGAEIDYSPYVRMMKNLFAEYLHHWMPQKILEYFVVSCDDPSAKNVRRTLNCLKNWLAKRAPSDQMAGAIIHFVRENIAELTTELRTDVQAYRRFLPDPDKSTRNTPVWILPNLSSFANIYGRINMLHESKVSDVTLVHDEQRQFERILRDGKTLAENLAARGGEFVLPHSNFRFTESAKLKFATSHESAGIQAADAIAGFIMRYVKAVLSLGRPDVPHSIAFDSLIRLSEPERGTGLNFVLSHADLERLGIREAQ